MMRVIGLYYTRGAARDEGLRLLGCCAVLGDAVGVILGAVLGHAVGVILGAALGHAVHFSCNIRRHTVILAGFTLLPDL